MVCLDVSIDRDQRYTPEGILTKVDLILGGIGLDPTANPQKTVPARNHITEAENCLTTNWAPLLTHLPTAFMNPPYSNTASFLSRWVDYVHSGDIQSGITLTLAGALANKSTQNLIGTYARAVVHPFGRINFMNGGRSNDRDVVFVLWGAGSNLDAFARELNGLCCEIRR